MTVYIGIYIYMFCPPPPPSSLLPPRVRSVCHRRINPTIYILSRDKSCLIVITVAVLSSMNTEAQMSPSDKLELNIQQKWQEWHELMWYNSYSYNSAIQTAIVCVSVQFYYQLNFDNLMIIFHCSRIYSVLNLLMMYMISMDLMVQRGKKIHVIYLFNSERGSGNVIG